MKKLIAVAALSAVALTAGCNSKHDAAPRGASTDAPTIAAVHHSCAGVTVSENPTCLPGAYTVAEGNCFWTLMSNQAWYAGRPHGKWVSIPVNASGDVARAKAGC